MSRVKIESMKYEPEIFVDIQSIKNSDKNVKLNLSIFLGHEDDPTIFGTVDFKDVLSSFLEFNRSFSVEERMNMVETLSKMKSELERTIKNLKS